MYCSFLNVSFSGSFNRYLLGICSVSERDCNESKSTIVLWEIPINQHASTTLPLAVLDLLVCLFVLLDGCDDLRSVLGSVGVC